MSSCSYPSVDGKIGCILWIWLSHRNHRTTVGDMYFNQRCFSAGVRGTELCLRNIGGKRAGKELEGRKNMWVSRQFSCDRGCYGCPQAKGRNTEEREQFLP